MDEENAKSAEDEFMTVMKEKLSHLKEDNKRKIQELVLGANTVASSIHYVRPENVPVKHSFVLKDPNTIYFRGCRIP